MAKKKTNKTKNDTIREVRINLTVENKAFMQLVCESKGIDKHTYINQLIKEQSDKSNTNVTDILTKLEKL